MLADTIAEAGASVDYVPGCHLPLPSLPKQEGSPGESTTSKGSSVAASGGVEMSFGQVMAGHARPATSLLPDYFRGYHRASTVYSYDPRLQVAG